MAEVADEKKSCGTAARIRAARTEYASVSSRKLDFSSIITETGYSKKDEFSSASSGSGVMSRFFSCWKGSNGREGFKMDLRGPRFGFGALIARPDTGAYV